MSDYSINACRAKRSIDNDFKNYYKYYFIKEIDFEEDNKCEIVKVSEYVYYDTPIENRMKTYEEFKSSRKDSHKNDIYQDSEEDLRIHYNNYIASAKDEPTVLITCYYLKGDDGKLFRVSREKFEAAPKELQVDPMKEHWAKVNKEIAEMEIKIEEIKQKNDAKKAAVQKERDKETKKKTSVVKKPVSKTNISKTSDEEFEQELKKEQEKNNVVVMSHSKRKTAFANS